MTRRIIKYKTLLGEIYKHTLKNGSKANKDELDQLIKYNAGVSGSCKLMTNQQLSDLIESAEFMAVQIGLETKK